MKIDLIEQLGGYEKAKVEFEAMKQHRELYKGEFDKNDAILLQYRREHNIFEKDDFIVFDVSKPFCAKLPTDLMKIKNPKYQEHDMIVHMNNQIYVVDGKSVRHAEPEEIQANRRLEVCGG